MVEEWEIYRSASAILALKNNCYTMSLFGSEKNMNAKFTCQFVPIGESASSVRKSGKCFGINFQTFKTFFIKENRKYTVTITINEDCPKWFKLMKIQFNYWLYSESA